MILVDSGYLIALAKPRDELHARAQAWTEHVTGPLLLPEYVLWEAINYLSLPLDRAKAHVLIAHIAADPAYALILASPHLFNAGLQMHRDRPDKAWSLTDCISFHIMRERGITQALAYDHHFEQAEFDALLRRDPPN
ncbi:MAG: PIN domain-containing protein [Pedosphaera sp.]|nr:PIN domain-containing protein [Pedosphaera sp.]